MRVQNGTIWLSQKNMGELFLTSSDNIGLHLKNIFKEGELGAASGAKEFSLTAADGKIYTVRHDNLDAIIAVGYLVKGAMFLTTPLAPRLDKIRFHGFCGAAVNRCCQI